MKKRFIMIFFVIFVYMVVLIYENSKLTPFDILRKEYDNQSFTFKPSNAITQVDITHNKILLFYYNFNNNLSCAVIEKTFFSYNIVGISAEISPNTNLPAQLTFNSFKKGQIGISWGILSNKLISKVLVNNQEAVMIDINNIKLCYFFEQSENIIFEPNYKFFDKYGRVININ